MKLQEVAEVLEILKNLLHIATLLTFLLSYYKWENLEHKRI